MMNSDEGRRVWMGQLALLCSPAFPVNAGKVLVAMLPHLAEYGDEYFTDEVLRLVARAPRRQSVPSYDEICNVFGEWWRARRAPARLAAPPPPPEPERKPPSPEEIARVEALIASMKAALVGQTASGRDRGDYAPPAQPGAVPPPSGRSMAENPFVPEARREQVERSARAHSETSINPCNQDTSI